MNNPQFLIIRPIIVIKQLEIKFLHVKMRCCVEICCHIFACWLSCFPVLQLNFSPFLSRSFETQKLRLNLLSLLLFVPRFQSPCGSALAADRIKIEEAKERLLQTITRLCSSQCYSVNSFWRECGQNSLEWDAAFDCTEKFRLCITLGAKE